MPEQIGIEGRGSFYEATGAFRDMISTHLCQLLGFVAMDPPQTCGSSEALHDAKAKVFASMRAFDRARIVLEQYDGYREEDGVVGDSTVETLVGLMGDQLGNSLRRSRSCPSSVPRSISIAPLAEARGALTA